MFEIFFVFSLAELAGVKMASVFQNHTDLVQGPESCRGLVDSGEPAHLVQSG